MRDQTFGALDELLEAIRQVVDLSEFSVRQKQVDALIIDGYGKTYKLSIKPCRASLTKEQALARYGD